MEQQRLGSGRNRVVVDFIQPLSGGGDYRYTDLGGPQKLTDANQATVWDGQFDPFGEERHPARRVGRRHHRLRL